MVATRVADADFFTVEISGATFEVDRGLYRSARTADTSPAEPSGRTAEVSVTLPAQALVDAATATVSARAPGRTPLSGIAQVRSTGDDPAASANSLVLDFGGFATLSGLDLPVGVSSVLTWTGAAFAALTGVSISGGQAAFAGEVMTTKLLVNLDRAASPATVQNEGFASLPAVPTGMSLTVDGATVWRADPALILAKGSAEAGADVDITTFLRAAIGAADRVVPVGLQVDQPAVISVRVEAPLLLTHDVDLGVVPPSVVADEEGDHDVTLTLPAAAGSWRVHHVIAGIDADPPDERVLPEVGPPRSDTYALTLAPGNPLLVRLAAAPLRRLGVLCGVRVPVLAGADGAELAGVLLTGDPSLAPGAPLDGGVLAPLILPAPQRLAPPGPPEWVTLALAKPVPTPTDDDVLWLSLQVARGTVDLAVAAPGASAADDASVFRLDPTGVVVALSHARAAPPPLGSVRLVGTPPEQAPVPPARLLLGADAAADVVPGTPVTLSPATPVTPVAGASLTLTLRVAAPATYGVQTVRLVYEEAGA